MKAVQRSKRTTHGRRGACAVEMALIMPLFLTIVLGCVDFGRFTYTYITLANAVRAGAAWTMLNKPSSLSSPTTSWQTSVKSAVSNEMSLQSGFNSSSLTVSTVSPVSETGGTWRFTITASYPFHTIINWSTSGYGITNSMTLTQQVTMRGIR